MNVTHVPCCLLSVACGACGADDGRPCAASCREPHACTCADHGKPCCARHYAPVTS